MNKSITIFADVKDKNMLEISNIYFQVKDQLKDCCLDIIEENFSLQISSLTISVKLIDTNSSNKEIVGKFETICNSNFGEDGWTHSIDDCKHENNLFYDCINMHVHNTVYENAPRYSNDIEVIVNRLSFVINLHFNSCKCAIFDVTKDYAENEADVKLIFVAPSKADMISAKNYFEKLCSEYFPVFDVIRVKTTKKMVDYAKRFLSKQEMEISKD